MSETIYNHFSFFLDFIKKNPYGIYTMKPDAYSERFGIPIETAKVIKSLTNNIFSHRGYVYAGLLALAKMPEVSPTFWTNFRPSITYIFIEFAKNNFFPFTHIDNYNNYENDKRVVIKRLDIEGYCAAYAQIIGKSREYEKLYPIVSENAQTYDNYLAYISTRSRGNPEQLAKLILATKLIPDPFFDWNSCLRGDETEQLMMFGIEKYDATRFIEWSDLYEHFHDDME